MIAHKTTLAAEFKHQFKISELRLDSLSFQRNIKKLSLKRDFKGAASHLPPYSTTPP